MTDPQSSTAAPADPMDRFILLCKNANDKPYEIRAVIHQALSHDTVYNGFAELLALPSVQKLKKTGNNNNSDHEPSLRTLELFAYGTYLDFIQAKEDTYLPLTSKQIHKLKKLSIISLVQRSTNPVPIDNDANESDSMGRSNTVPYASLLHELGMNDRRELEDLLIECIYANIISGKLDQQKNCFLLSPTGTGMFCNMVSRDVKLDVDLPTMISRLEAWESQSLSVLNALKQSGLHSASGRQKVEEEWSKVEEKISEMNMKGDRGSGGGVAALASAGGVAVGVMDMDLGMGLMDSHHAKSSPVGHYAQRDRKTKRSRGGLGFERGLRG